MKKKIVACFIFLLFVISAQAESQRNFTTDQNFFEISHHILLETQKKLNKKRVSSEILNQSVGAVHSLAQLLKIFPRAHEIIGEDTPDEDYAKLIYVETIQMELMWAERLLRTDLKEAKKHLSDALSLISNLK